MNYSISAIPHLILVTILSASVSNAQVPGCEWARTYYLGGDQNASAVTETSDGGYLIGGYTWAFGNADMCLIKTDFAGDTEWTMTYEGAEECTALIPTSDGGCIVAGTASVPESYTDYYLAKLDDSGAIEWERTYGTDGADECYSAYRTSDGGYILCGETHPSAVYLVKVDSLGTFEWESIIDEGSTDRVYAIQETDDGGYIAGGWTFSLGAGATDLYLLKTDSFGEKEWAAAFGGEYMDYGHYVQQTSDGGYIMTGILDVTHVESDLYIVKTDASGAMEWDLLTGYDAHGMYVQEMPDGGYVVAGDQYAWTFLLMRITSNGQAEWISSPGLPEDMGSASCASSQQTSDGGFIMAGRHYSPSVGYNFRLVKIESLEAGESQGNPLQSLSVSPNPFQESSLITYNVPVESNVEVSVYNLLGQKMAVLIDEPQTPGVQSLSWDGTDSLGEQVPCGIYYVHIKAGGLLTSQMLTLIP